MSAFLQRLVDSAANLPPLAVPVPRSASPIFAHDQRFGIPGVDLAGGLDDAPITADPLPPLPEARSPPAARSVSPAMTAPPPRRPVMTAPMPGILPVDDAPLPPAPSGMNSPVPSAAPVRPAVPHAASAAPFTAMAAGARPLPDTVQEVERPVPPPRLVPPPAAPVTLGPAADPAPPAPVLRPAPPAAELRQVPLQPEPPPPAQPRRSLMADVTRARPLDLPPVAAATRPAPELRPAVPRMAERAPPADLPPPRTEVVRETVRIIEKVIAEPRREVDDPPRLPVTAHGASVIGSLEPMRWRNRVFALRRL